MLRITCSNPMLILSDYVIQHDNVRTIRYSAPTTYIRVKYDWLYHNNTCLRTLFSLVHELHIALCTRRDVIPLRHRNIKWGCVGSLFDSKWKTNFYKRKVEDLLRMNFSYQKATLYPSHVLFLYSNRSKISNPQQQKQSFFDRRIIFFR